MMRNLRRYSIIPFVLLTVVGQTQAGGRATAIQETVEYLFGRFGRTAFREGAETLARKVEVMVTRHGDDFLKAVRQVGPRVFLLVEEARAHANQAVRAMAQFGEHGATWIVARPKAMQMVAKYGEEAAATLVKHKGVAEAIIEQFGRPALKALQVAGTQNARRLGMMIEGGELARIGRSHELLEVVATYGDRAMTFVWQHKGALATAAGLAAFLSQPESFINGAKDMAQIVGESAIKPLMEIPGSVATEMARGTNWMIIFVCAGLAGLILLAAKFFLLGKALPGFLKRKTADTGPVSAPGADMSKKATVVVQETATSQLTLRREQRA
jgi:hypothetical protein